MILLERLNEWFSAIGYKIEYMKIKLNWKINLIEKNVSKIFLLLPLKRYLKKIKVEILHLTWPPSPSTLCNSRHSSIVWAKSTWHSGTFTSPIWSCFENRSKSKMANTNVLFIASAYGRLYNDEHESGRKNVHH